MMEEVVNKAVAAKLQQKAQENTAETAAPVASGAGGDQD